MTTPDRSSLGKSRAASRGWVTRVSNNLHILCQKDNIDLNELSDAIDEFDKRLNALDSVQSQVELVLEDSEIEDDIDKAAAFRDKVRVPRVYAAKLLKQKISTKCDGNKTGSHASIEAKLPKLELPSFSGDCLEWTTFWDQFSAIVDLSDLPDITKFTYLRSLLKNEAKASVEGLALTAANYKAACKILCDRFGRPERIIFSHIQTLLNISVPSKCSKVSALWALHNQLSAQIRSLESLGVAGGQYGVILTPIVLSRLPPEIRLEWAREGEGKESDIAWLLDFLEKEIKRRERSQTFKEKAPDEKPMRVAAAAALQASGVSRDSRNLAPASARGRCLICGKAHRTDRCWDITRIPLSDRQARLQQSNVCYRCLGKGHFAKGCMAKCSKCKGRHHLVLCGAQNSKESASICDKSVTNVANVRESVSTDEMSLSPVSHTTVSTPRPASRQKVILQVAQVKVSGSCGSKVATVLFDTGSDRTYVSGEFVRKVDPEWVGAEPLAYAAFGTEQPSKSTLRNIFKLNMKCVDSSSVSVLATEVPTLCSPIRCPCVPDGVRGAFSDLRFVDAPTDGKEVKVDILIGLDSYWKLVKPSSIVVREGLVAQETMFGWVLSGTVSNDTPNISSTCSVQSHPLLCFDICESAVHRFWDLESIGISDETFNKVHPVQMEFEKDIAYIGDRYQVALPWKSNAAGKLQNNEGLARKRLENLNKRLVKTPVLASKYNENIRDMEVSGIVEEVPSKDLVSPYPTFYLPHHPVVRESSITTKIRPVFDASASGYNGISLNDCMETGPNLLPNLVEILIRFRRWKVAVSADITKAFLQVAVQRSDQDVHRFLWKDGGTIRTMRFVRVPFGNCSSPFLLNATIRHHLSTVPLTRVVQELKDNFYVDDVLSGADTDQEACEMIQESISVMDKAGMSLSKWCSNSPGVAEMLSRDFEDKHLAVESLKVLGLRWLAQQDCFTFDGLEIPDDVLLTKRQVLSIISRLFDPLGLITPYSMLAKCLFQELWRMGLSWDEVIPVELQQRFQLWMAGLKELKSWRVPRNFTGHEWRANVSVSLQAFGDASEKGYGACVYLVAKLCDGACTSSLITSKARVAPLKKLSLPRLELMGALLCARLVKFVQKALHLPADVAYTCWTDSTVVLTWIKADPHKWKVFVANRVAEIHGLTSPSHWAHCPGSANPADLVTRGIYASDLIKSDLWLTGPDFLVDCSNVSPVFVVQPETDNLTERAAPVVTMTTKHVDGPLFDFGRWGSFEKCIRVIAWVLRFGHIMKDIKALRSPELSYEELSAAKHQLFRCVQREGFGEVVSALHQGGKVPKCSPIAKLSPFIGYDGLLRVGGRIQHSDLTYEEKHPIILPKCRVSLLLVRFQHLLTKHAGVATLLATLRCHYWIIGARRLAKQVKAECVACQRQDSVRCSQPMAPLPADRVVKSPPFSITGMDHAGPLHCVDFPKRKFYVLLFTCAVVRAVHLELVNSLNLVDCILAIRRFVARRGLPSIIYSDNAKTFKAAQGKLIREYGHLSPKWKYIAPRSPWWGGWWERLVRSVKSALKKSLGTRVLTRCELETSLHEVEAQVNSRPLTYVAGDYEGSGPLSPSHFLLGRPSAVQPVAEASVSQVSSEDLVSRDVIRKRLLDTFWSLWSSEYIRNLPTARGEPAKGELAEGSVVLVRDAGLPRMQWPLGVVSSVFPGRDGIIRAVNVRTSNGVLCRPIQLLHKIELSPVSDTPVSGSAQLDTHAHAQINPDIPVGTDMVSMDTLKYAGAINKPKPDNLDSEKPAVARNVPDTSNMDTQSDVCTIPVTGNRAVSRFGRRLKPVKRLAYE